MEISNKVYYVKCKVSRELLNHDMKAFEIFKQQSVYKKFKKESGLDPVFWYLTYQDDDRYKNLMTIFVWSIARDSIYITADKDEILIAIEEVIKENPHLVFNQKKLPSLGWNNTDFMKLRITAEAYLI